MVEKVKQMKKKNPIRMPKPVKSPKSITAKSMNLRSANISKVRKLDSDSENHEIEDFVNPLEEDFGVTPKEFN